MKKRNIVILFYKDVNYVALNQVVALVSIGVPTYIDVNEHCYSETCL